MDLDGLNMLGNIARTIAYRPRACNRIRLRACSVRYGLVEHHLDGSVAVVCGGQRHSSWYGVALDCFIARKRLNKYRCSRVFYSDDLGIAGGISAAIGRCPRAQDFILAIAISGVDGLPIVAVFDRFVRSLAVVRCSQFAGSKQVFQRSHSRNGIAFNRDVRRRCGEFWTHGVHARNGLDVGLDIITAFFHRCVEDGRDFLSADCSRHSGHFHQINNDVT